MCLIVLIGNVCLYVGDFFYVKQRTIFFCVIIFLWVCEGILFCLCCTTVLIMCFIITVDNINISVINVFCVVSRWFFDRNDKFRLILSICGHGESFESEPNECIGNNGYQPPVYCLSLIVSKNISAPPRPWLWSKPVPRCQTMMTIERPKISAPCKKLNILKVEGGHEICHLKLTEYLRVCL